MSAGDKYAYLGQMLYGSWSLWANWVNIAQGGITVGSQKWGVQITQVEDYSNATFDKYTAGALLSEGTIDIMFAPYSSGLTTPVLPQTEDADMLLLAAGSNSNSLWNGDVQYGFGTLYAAEGDLPVALPLYEQQGARTAAYFCSTDPNANTCTISTQESLTSTFAAAGITLTYYYEVDPTADDYASVLASNIAEIADANVDLVTIHDYSALCIDGIADMQAIDWTPAGVYLQVCNNDVNVVAELGSGLWYAGSYSMYATDAQYTSGITGITNTEFVSMWSQQYGLVPTYQAAASFAAGEILYAAITQRATQVNCVNNPAQCTNGPALASIIESGTWSTIMSSTSLTFGSQHLAIGEWVTLQYNTDSVTYAITTDAPLVYPMPSWSDRSSTTTAATDDDDGSGCGTVNNYNSNSNDDASPMKVATALTVTAIFCFLGGLVIMLIAIKVMQPVFALGAGTAAPTPPGSGSVAMNPIASKA